MPWQRYVADVALEVEEDPNTGIMRPAYRQVVLTVPRQSGKTTLLLSVLIHRCLAWGSAQQVTYAAQTGVAARAKFMDEHVPLLERSVFSNMIDVRRTNGHEAVVWANRSRHSISAATEKAGHGQTLDLAVIDEAFAYPDARLEQAFVPAMQTRHDAQLWIVSTAGTPASTYLRDKVDAGRAMIDAGHAGRTAYFEWSAPDDAPSDDPATWWSCMPALGVTVDEATVQAARESMPDDEFRRAFLNQWRDGQSAEGGFPASSWSACADVRATPLDPVVFGVDVSPNAGSASIVVAGKTIDGRDLVEVVDQRPGAGWVAGRLLELAARWAPAAITIDATGPAASLIPSLERERIPLIVVSGSDSAKAAGLIYSAVLDNKLVHRDDPALNAAVAGAVRRSAGDAWRWNRKDSSTDISPLCAATVAHWISVQHQPRTSPSVIDLSRFLEDMNVE
jgi:phage terminase large subunit-like protein